MAAGVSMPTGNIGAFRAYLNEHCDLTPDDFEEKIHIDVPMPMAYVTTDFIRQLSRLEPFGNGNPKPVFAQKNLRLIRGRILGKNSNVGRYVVMDDAGRQFEMMYFGDMEAWHDFLESSFGREESDRLYHGGSCRICISVIYYPELDTYQGREKIKMIMQDYCKGDA